MTRDARTSPALGETVSSSTEEVVVESAALGAAPGIGDVVVAGDLLLAVTRVETGPIDRGRTTVALGLDGGDAASDHPELAALLRTTFTLTPLATLDGGVPTSPAPLHAPVRSANAPELAVLTRDFGYLHRIAAASADVIASHVLAVAAARDARVRAAAALVPALLPDTQKLQRTLTALDRAP